ncbi:restriction endonuclease subunit S [Enterococcus faecium]|uniref:restriction endonuclease subunit S n=3 Tax=Enterococcus faecium TaxID=1352 RepID=UPI002892D1F3|nr:restriction endonuclease subunit S [Enterococcus faecium]
MNRWKQTRLDEFIDFNPRESIPKGKLVKKIAMDKIEPYTRDIDEYELLEFKGGTKFKNGDTLMARITPSLENGKTAKVNLLDDDEIGFGSTEFIVARAKAGISDADFIYYTLSRPDIREIAIKSMAGSSGRQRVQLDVLKNYEVHLPDLIEQQKIAEILKVLDDKIENNRKINHHLSVIVQAIFNSWFVDYVPFGGTLPSEWKEVDFDEISTVQNGYAFKSKDYVSDGVRMIRTTNFDNGYVNNNDLIMLPSEFYNDAKYRNFVLKKFDTVLVMVGASVGKISLITELNTPALQNQNMWRFRSIIPEIPESFIHFNVKRINDQVRGWSSGSARDFYRKDIFKKAKVYLPTSQVLDDFSKITMPIFEQISNNILENDKLIKARDSLLPKLMSGEVSVTD